MTATVFIVEDESGLADLLAAYLKKENYTPVVFRSGNGVVNAVREQQPTALLLDLMLPGVDGLSICRDVRAFSKVPILMLTARVEEIDRLLGLELGADDYMCKPYSPREVMARLKAVLRRVQPGYGLYAEQQKTRLQLDDEAFQARWDNKALGLTPAEFRLLKILSGQPGRVFSRQVLMDRVYDDHRVVTDRTIDSHIKNLRRKLREAADDQEFLHGIYGIGYKFEWPAVD